MASLAILQLCFEYMSVKTLEDNMSVNPLLVYMMLLLSFCFLYRHIVMKYFILSLNSSVPQVMSSPLDGNYV